MGFSTKPAYKRTTPSDVFGHIPGVPVGSTFENRLFLHHASVHTGIVAGIAGRRDEGCFSLVLNGGYEDDKDHGDHFIYTGCGGRDKADGEKPRDGPQTRDQSMSHPRNASLWRSAEHKKPVRVIRGYKADPKFAPAAGYRYDGLYVVERAWMDEGKSGFKVCKYALRVASARPAPDTRASSPFEACPSMGRSVPSVNGSTEVLSPRKRKRTTSNSDKSHSSNRNAGSSKPSSSAPRIQSLPASSPEPIPLPTNAAPSRALQPVVSHAQPAAAPAMDVLALLAEWNGSASNSATTKPAAPAVPSARPHPAPPRSGLPSSNRAAARTADPRRRPPAKPTAALIRHPKPSDTAELEHRVKRIKLAPSSSSDPSNIGSLSCDSDLGELAYPDSEDDS
ncbi:PUA-like domain-containing protein [Earliella scabrosa]|nr:PUA-like domain-containing protein [Earliella scabrosa]